MTNELKEKIISLLEETEAFENAEYVLSPQKTIKLLAIIDGEIEFLEDRIEELERGEDN